MPLHARPDGRQVLGRVRLGGVAGMDGGSRKEGEERREDAHELALAEDGAFSPFELNEFSEARRRSKGRFAELLPC